MKAAIAKPRRQMSVSKLTGVDERTLENLVDVLKALSDRWRLMILMILAKDGETHVSAICKALGLSQPAVSHHLTQLRNAGLISCRRDGKFNYYVIDSTLVGEILERFYGETRGSQRKLTFGDLEVAFKTR